ncbi:hypothetical protein F5148DRAFT_1145495 [Russula earlei]|uniref:Uncharacterized protein n=1 Tax=Russula earlei TaxID=71964 RepID=A0ACC0UNK3_9AGAM|nr:hypothetical protein F5148DRAFT_1145495 [Russula earlei]
MATERTRKPKEERRGDESQRRKFRRVTQEQGGKRLATNCHVVLCPEVLTTWSSKPIWSGMDTMQERRSGVDTRSNRIAPLERGMLEVGQPDAASCQHPDQSKEHSRLISSAFCWVFYNPQYSIYEGSIEDWSSIFKPPPSTASVHLQ